MKRHLVAFDIREMSPYIAVAIIIWLALNLAFTFLVNVPRGRDIAALSESRTERNGVLERAQKDVTRLLEQRDRVAEGRKAMEMFYDDIISTKQERLISVQKEIREIAGRFNINLETVTYPREAYPKNKVIKFGATMPLTGSYESLRDFIDTIERSSNFIAIEAIQLTNSKEGGVILSLSIQLATWFADPDLRDKEGARQAGGRRG